MRLQRRRRRADVGDLRCGCTAGTGELTVGRAVRPVVGLVRREGDAEVPHHLLLRTPVEGGAQRANRGVQIRDGGRNRGRILGERAEHVAGAGSQFLADVRITGEQAVDLVDRGRCAGDQAGQLTALVGDRLRGFHRFRQRVHQIGRGLVERLERCGEVVQRPVHIRYRPTHLGEPVVQPFHGGARNPATVLQRIGQGAQDPAQLNGIDLVEDVADRGEGVLQGDGALAVVLGDGRTGLQRRGIRAVVDQFHRSDREQVAGDDTGGDVGRDTGEVIRLHLDVDVLDRTFVRDRHLLDRAHQHPAELHVRIGGQSVTGGAEHGGDIDLRIHDVALVAREQQPQCGHDHDDTTGTGDEQLPHRGSTPTRIDDHRFPP